MTIAWTMQSALVFIAIALWIGDVVASLTKARVPSILIIAIIFVVGYWTILPQDFLDIALITYFYQFVNFVIMVHIGTLFNLRELKSEWKVVVITLAAVVGIVITVYLLGQYIPWVGKAQALAMAPPFTGGLMAALIMGEAGNAAGMPALGTLSSICFIMQGFVGFPLTALFLKKEATRVLGEIDKGSWVVEEKKEESEQKKALVDRVPEKLKGNYWYILELCFYGWIAKLLSDFLNTTFNSTLWSTSITGIVVGILAAALGIIDTSPMNKAQSYGFLNWALTAYFMP